MINTTKRDANHEIKAIQVTTDLLADRGGLFPLMAYIDHTGIVDVVSDPLQQYRTGSKGVPVTEIVRQLFAFFADGTSRHLTYFDQVRKDAGYCGLLETPRHQMVSSHQVKRLFGKLPTTLSGSFRKVLRNEFATRLKHEKPEILELFLDTMVLDNDDAESRQGCSPTYKKVKGFQPLQLIWDGMIIDAQFRGGKKHGNHGNTVFHMIDKVVKEARKILGYEVAVLVRMDSGFFDGKLFQRLDATNIGFVCSGKLSKDVKTIAAQQEEWKTLQGSRQSWNYFEFDLRCRSWKRGYRGIYLKPIFEGEQKIGIGTSTIIRPVSVCLPMRQA